MSIKRYIANKDTTISDAYLSNMIDTAKDSNMGASDSLEIFSLYGQANTGSVEKSRILVQFPVEEIINDRNISRVPASGSVKFFLRMFNVEHPYSVPKEFSADVLVISQSWDEGYGLDMESYSDLGINSSSINGFTGFGCTWKYRTAAESWTMGTNSPGGSYLTQSQYCLKQSFFTGLEDIELDVTNVVEDWISSTIDNNGFIVKLSGAYEDGSLKNSFYTKKFSGRGSEFFFKKPIIEARWESITNDDRNKFFASSSALSSDDNKMNLYFYNKVNGTKKNIVGNIVPQVKFYLDSQLTTEISTSYLQVTNPVQGTYKVQVCLDTTASVIYDRWFSGSNNFFNGSFDVIQRKNYDYDDDGEYTLKILNNKLNYNNKEVAKFKVFCRKKDWQPTIYSVATNTIENEILTDLYYKIFRLNDNYAIIDYSTGSLAYTKLSYDSNENYFDLDMSIFEKGYNYGIKLARWNGVELKELPTIFKFKVE